MNKNKGLHLALLISASTLAAPIYASAADLPTGGQIVAGAGSISQSGTTMTVQQDSTRMTAHWDSFSIGNGHTVNFHQPSSSAVALNRVLGGDVSVIQGAINANGHVFLVNPNGVMFSPTAQVNVGGLVASTLDISTDDFMAGRYSFEGNSNNAVINEGNIHAPGGTVALIAAQIINNGTISADRGHILMGAGSKVTLDLGGPVKLEVEQGALDTLIEQGGALKADGGKIYLTAKAASALATSVINHTGISEAKTLVTGEKGEIILLGDMDVGITRVAGELNATAPAGGDGGFIETSAAVIDIAEGTKITAEAPYGKGGHWLIDPFDYVINDTAAGNIASALNTGTDVTVETTANNTNYGSTGSGTNGNIKVASAIEKTTGGNAILTLRAENVIDLAAPITSTAGALDLNLEADSDSNGSGVIIATKGVSLNGGNLNFGTGATAMLNGVSTLVGGDMYVGGTDQVVFRTGGGHIDLRGELIIANPEGVKFITDNGNAHFYGIINGGNKYEKITSPNMTWDYAFQDAKNGTAGQDAIGDSYLATVTSRLENSVIVYTGGFVVGASLSQGAWLGGMRVEGIGTDTTWRWVTGPESLEDGGQGLPFSLGAVGNAPINGSFINWQGGEPNGGVGGENRLQIGDAQGRWNDLANNDLLLGIYIRETNYGDADLEIDAGTGTITFDGPIGELKGINYKAYDVSNPKPSAPPSPIPQTSAVAGAQTINTQQPGTAISNGYSDPRLGYITHGSSGGPSTQNAGTPGQSRLSVGSMEVVQISAEQGNQMESTASDEGIASAVGAQGEISHLTKVFVVEGGIHLPPGTQSDSDEQDRE